MKYSMHEVACQWLAALEIVYTELTTVYNYGCNEHGVACTCDNCIYRLLLIQLEEHLEAKEIS